jgi:hypothetical protein
MPDFAFEHGEALFKMRLAEGFFDFWEARHERNAAETLQKMMDAAKTALTQYKSKKGPIIERFETPDVNKAIRNKLSYAFFLYVTIQEKLERKKFETTKDEYKEELKKLEIIQNIIYSLDLRKFRTWSRFHRDHAEILMYGAKPAFDSMRKHYKIRSKKKKGKTTYGNLSVVLEEIMSALELCTGQKLKRNFGAQKSTKANRPAEFTNPDAFFVAAVMNALEPNISIWTIKNHLEAL